jgi:hypothetical protein
VDGGRQHPAPRFKSYPPLLLKRLQWPYNRFCPLYDPNHSEQIERDCAASERPLIGSGVFGAHRFRFCVAIVAVGATKHKTFMSVVLIQQ